MQAALCGAVLPGGDEGGGGWEEGAGGGGGAAGGGHWINHSNHIYSINHIMR